MNTALDSEFDERFGFADEEVSALASYLGHDDCMEVARERYDSYRFGNSDVYNPWSVLNYFRKGCAPDVYWGNTSSNGAHMLLLGLLFGMPGYGDPESNREHDMGRPDIRVQPAASPFSYGERHLVTVELKFAGDATDEELGNLARAGLAQIVERGYDQGCFPPRPRGACAGTSPRAASGSRQRARGWSRDDGPFRPPLRPSSKPINLSGKCHFTDTI